MALDRLYFLYSLHLSGEATPEELSELAALLKEHPEAGLSLDAIKGLWKGAPEGAEEKEVGRAYNRHLQRMSTRMAADAGGTNDTFAGSGVSVTAAAGVIDAVPPGAIRRRLWVWTAAAAIGVLAIAGARWLQHRVAASAVPNAISTKRGSKTRIELPDGTQVWLNADSRLTYDAGSFGRDRQVNLEGEAYFDVARDERHPFVLHTKTVVVQVLGTVFNVRCYPDERTTETSLFQGSVEVIAHDKRIILKPNERLTVSNDDAEQKRQTQLPLLALAKVHVVSRDSIGIEAEWTKGKLAFDNEPLGDIARDIARWYDVTVSIRDEDLKQVPFTATFDDEPLDSVLHALALAGGNFHYVIRKKEVVIDPFP